MAALAEHPLGADLPAGSECQQDLVLDAMARADCGGAESENRWQGAFEAGREAEQLGRYAEAAELYGEALQEAERLGPADPRLADSLAALGVLHARHGRYLRESGKAAPLLERALAIRDRTPGLDQPEVARLLIHLAALCPRHGTEAGEAVAERAAGFFRRALAILAEAPPIDQDLLALTFNTVGSVAGALSQQGRAAEGEALYHQMIALQDRRSGPESQGAAVELSRGTGRAD